MEGESGFQLQEARYKIDGDLALRAVENNGLQCSMLPIPHYLPDGDGDSYVQIHSVQTSFSSDWSFLREHHLQLFLELDGQVHTSRKQTSATAVYKWLKASDGSPFSFRVREVPTVHHVNQGMHLLIRVVSTESKALLRKIKSRCTGSGLAKQREIGTFAIPLLELGLLPAHDRHEMEVRTFVDRSCLPPRLLPPALCRIRASWYHVSEGTRIPRCRGLTFIGYKLVVKYGMRYLSLHDGDRFEYALGVCARESATLQNGSGLYVSRSPQSAAKSWYNASRRDGPHEESPVLLLCVCEGPFIEYGADQIACSALTPLEEVPLTDDVSSDEDMEEEAFRYHDDWTPTLSEEQRCRSCGAGPLPPSAGFCRNCGYRRTLCTTLSGKQAYR